ncbi:MAG: zf-HC2 domain-containing protein [Chitinophagales bacterium]
MENHDCTDIIEQIHLLLDGELSLEEEDRLMQEIDRCYYCIESFNLEKRFKQYVANRISRKTLPKAVLEQVLVAIQD